MSETDLTLPAGFRFLKVLCNFGVIRPDGADLDRFPDFRTQGGQVTIVANAPRIRHLAVTGAGRMVNLPDEIFTVQPSTGALLDAQGEALYLLDPLSDDIDPRGFTYTATVKSATDLTPWKVTFGGDVQLPAEVDLVRLASIAPSTGTASLEQRIAALEASAGTGGDGPTSTEDVQDIVGAMVLAAGGTYDDAAGTITLPSGGGSSTIVADDTPAAPAEGESASYLVTSAVVWPAGLVWSTDPDGGTAPTITGTALVSMFTVSGVTRAIMGATFPGVVVPDTTAPAWSATLTTGTPATTSVVVAASALATDAGSVTYERSLNSGGSWAAVTPSGLNFTLTGLTAATAYPAPQFRAKDAAGNYSTVLSAQAFTTGSGVDTTKPTPGTLAASAITSSGFTLTVTGASDTGGLHATPYAYSTDNGTTWSAWQAGATYNATGLAASTGYQARHKVRDAAGNEETGTAVTVTTTAAPVVVVADTFDRANSSTLGTSSSGHTWVNAAAGIGIANNQATRPSGSGAAYSIIDVGQSDMLVELDFVATPIAYSPQMVIRGNAGNTTYYRMMRTNNPQTAALMRVIDGAQGPVLSTITFADGDRIGVSVKEEGGATILKVYKNGVQQGTTITDTSIGRPAGTYAGFSVAGSTTLVDNFSVSGV